MWQTDSVILQTPTKVNNFGVETITWTTGATVSCDVQEVNKELAYKQWGFTESTLYAQIYDHTQASWVTGNQVKYEGDQWLVRKVDANMGKMGASNHTFVVISKVV